MPAAISAAAEARAASEPEASLPAGGWVPPLAAAYAARPWRLVRYAVGDWLVIVLAWFVMWRVPHPAVYFAGVLLVAGRFHALGVVLHDACHLPLHRRAPELWLVVALAGWPIGSTLEAMRYHHLRHHRAPCLRADPYLHLAAARGFWARRVLMLRGALLPLWWSLRALVAPLALALPEFRGVYARGFLQDRSGQPLARHTEVLLCARRDLAQLGAHLGAALLIVRLELPFLTMYLVPWILGGILNANRVLIEHEHIESADRSPTAVWERTRSHDFGWLGRLFLCPHNIGFHQAHHVYPRVALEHLPALHRALAGRAVTFRSAPRGLRASRPEPARPPG